MNYEYDKDLIKNSLDINQVKDLLAEFGGDPYIQNNVIISRTICHNHIGEGSHKLYYYDNTKLFHCYTGCAEPTFDIFELIRKIKSRENNIEYELPFAIDYVAKRYNFIPINNFGNNQEDFINTDFTYIKDFDRINSIELEEKKIELKIYDDTFLKNFPKPIIQPWINDGISQEIMDYYEICYDPKNCGIVIPHRDINGRLIGVRERTLIQENAELYGKYLPLRIGKKMYNHPLSFNLYGLYQNQEHIKQIRKAFIFESEKSVLQYATMFGQENNIACAICGSSFISYQAWLLINLGVKEIIVGLDKQYQKLNDAEHKKLVKNLKNIHKKYGQYINISYLFDKEKLLNYKDSPTDRGEEVFLKLYKRKVNIYE